MKATLAESYSYCEKLTRTQAGNFYPAFRVLAAPERRAMCALYAFMRVADDLSDEPNTVEHKRAALAEYRRQYHDCLTGTYAHPLHPALHHIMTTYQIPPGYPEAVLDGVEMDLTTTHYATFEDLYRYCYRVASAVGLCCIHIWGFNDSQAPKLAEKAGIALQLTNILRDLGEDASRGRVYLPGEDLNRFGYDEQMLHQGVCNDSFRALMRFEAERAQRYYAESAGLLQMLPPPGRAVFQVMFRTYHGLLEAIVERNYDVFSERVRLSRWRKLRLVLQAIPTRYGWNPSRLEKA
jgi:15-cis-phytoene synthase